MAKPIRFRPAPIDPKLELQKRLDVAPVEHAEALLVAWDVLQAAHDKGILDALHGILESKDTILETVSKYAKTPEGIAGVRNLLASAKILTLIDPEMLDDLSKVVADAKGTHELERTPPSLWTIAKRTMSEDGRRGLSLMTLMLTGLGKSLKR